MEWGQRAPGPFFIWVLGEQLGACGRQRCDLHVAVSLSAAGVLGKGSPSLPASPQIARITRETHWQPLHLAKGKSLDLANRVRSQEHVGTDDLRIQGKAPPGW